MKILIVDDTEVMLLLIGRFIETMGHQIVLARNGAEGVEAFLREQPDMVLMDMIMPVMDGPQAARKIKQCSAGKWIPIVFVTAVGEENKLAEAIEQGADDYLTKPINFRVLEAKTKAIERTVNLNKKVWEQSVKLAEYYERAEEEKRVARHLMDQMINTERLADPQLQYWISSAESLSGDLIAVARTPGQVLYVVLADGIGHGLTAALNVLPLTQPFYTMTEKGFPLTDILCEMNNKIRQVLPVGRFVAMAFLAIDNVNNRIEVWNGGIPDIILINKDGQQKKVWKSKNLPLGILPTEQLDVSCEGYCIDEAATVLICSDGLIEARNRNGDIFGADNLVSAVAPQPLPERMNALTVALTDFLQGDAHHDDISVVMVEVGYETKYDFVRSSGVFDYDLFEYIAKNGGSAVGVNWRHSVLLGVPELRYMNVVPFIMTFMSQIKGFEGCQSDIFLILTELFVNGVDHGLLRLNSRLKTGSDGMENYLLERSRRLSELASGSVEVELAGVSIEGSEWLRIYVKDSGEGFDWGSFTADDPSTQLSQFYGRGVGLVRSLCASMVYQGKGNEVVAYYRIRK